MPGWGDFLWGVPPWGEDESDSEPPGTSLALWDTPETWDSLLYWDSDVGTPGPGPGPGPGGAGGWRSGIGDYDDAIEEGLILRDPRPRRAESKRD